MTHHTRFDHAKIMSLAATMTADEVARQIGCSIATVAYVRRKVRAGVSIGQSKLSSGRQRVKREQHGAPRATVSRHVLRPIGDAPAAMPAINNPALSQGRTIYSSTVIRESDAKNGLKSGEHSAKIGAIILKGRWRGFPVYTLTLEERATCPNSCAHWRSCYGNSMHLAQRLRHGPDLEWRLEREIAALELRHRTGFAVRLHVLGDFYSVEYVNFWRKMLDLHPALHVFGFSARWDCPSDPIAAALVPLVMERWDRFAIRMSNAPIDECATRSIEHPAQCPPGVIICPAQQGKTESCSSCGLCWQTTRNVAFLQH